MKHKAPGDCGRFPAHPDRVAQCDPVLVGGEPPQRLRGPALPVPAHPAVELGHEVAQAPGPPVPAVEELALQQPEEALGARVVAAVALARHAPGDELASATSGPGETGQATGLPSRQSMTGLRWHLAPEGSRNSVMSVTHSSLGRPARNRWVPSGSSGRLGGAGERSPS